MRSGPNAKTRAQMERLPGDVVAILTELLHWKNCHVGGCKRCAPIDGRGPVNDGSEAERMFGKRYRDLSPAEKRSYHDLMRRPVKSR